MSVKHAVRQLFLSQLMASGRGRAIRVQKSLGRVLARAPSEGYPQLNKYCLLSISIWQSGSL